MVDQREKRGGATRFWERKREVLLLRARSRKRWGGLASARQEPARFSLHLFDEKKGKTKSGALWGCGAFREGKKRGESGADKKLSCPLKKKY